MIVFLSKMFSFNKKILHLTGIIMEFKALSLDDIINKVKNKIIKENKEKQVDLEEYTENLKESYKFVNSEEISSTQKNLIKFYNYMKGLLNIQEENEEGEGEDD